jgi:hypothetical protein
MDTHGEMEPGKALTIRLIEPSDSDDVALLIGQLGYE